MSAPKQSFNIAYRLPWFRQLWIRVFVAMLIGALLGWLRPGIGTAMQPLGDLFIKAIRVLIAPLIFCSVASGIASMQDSARVGRLAIKSIVYFEVMTTLALAVGLVFVNVLRPGEGMNINASQLNSASLDPYLKQIPATGGIIGYLINIIPSTFFGAFAEGNILQVLYLSVLCGFSLSIAGAAGQPLLRVIESATRMIFDAVGLVMWTAPVGAFGAMAFTVGKFGVGSLASLGRLVGDFYLTCFVFIIIAFGAVALICRFNLFKLVRYLGDELLVCIATTSSEVVLPRLMDKMSRAGCDRRVVDLVVPAGYSFNLDGTCLYLATAAVFLAQATATDLNLAQQIGLLVVLLVTSKGAAGVAGAAFVVLAATLSAHQTIPVASVALILGVHRLLSQGLTPTNYLGNAVATIALAKWEGALDEQHLRATLDNRARPFSPD